METLVMDQFKNKEPPVRTPVWVWFADLMAWRVAILDEEMYPLKGTRRQKLSWGLLNSEARHVNDDDWWTPAGEPDTNPPGF